MQIEITEKEKTALSILLGLRQKFARERKEKQTYSALELHKLFSELVNKINKAELRYLDTLNITADKIRTKDKIWDVIDNAIERSTIRRYEWKEVLGKSLTQKILELKKIGHNVDEVFKIIKKDKKVIEFIEEHEKEKRNIIKNLKISIHARFGENNTANKVMGS